MIGGLTGSAGGEGEARNEAATAAPHSSEEAPLRSMPTAGEGIDCGRKEEAAEADVGGKVEHDDEDDGWAGTEAA